MTDEDATVLLASVPSEIESSVIVAALEGEGIEARASGVMTSGFRAEAPGGVNILVRRSDRARALEILREHQAVDWSKVDVGDPEG